MSHDAPPDLPLDAATAPAWDDDPRWSSPWALDGDTRCDTCVVGLGGSGLAAVHALLDAGVDVIGLDTADVGAGAAGRNGGLLLAGIAHFHHDAVRRLGHETAHRWYAETLAELDRIFATSPETTRRTGSLRIAADDAEIVDCRAHLAALRRDGFPGEWYEGPEGVGLLLPSDGTMQPLARVRRLAREAMARGARLHARTAVYAIRGGRVVTEGGIVHARTVIVAVDGGIERLLPELQPEVRTARLQMCATAPARDVRLARPVYRRFGYDYVQQRDDGALLLGGFRDRCADDEWTHDDRPTAAVQGHLEGWLRAGLGASAPVTHRWGARVAYTESGAPVCRVVRPGVFAIGAYSGTGNVVGALCARRAVSWALGARTPAGYA